MNPPVKVSVIIPCYNLGKYLEEAVDSVLNQTYKNFELIIVNDGSTDDFTNKLLSNFNKDKTVVYTTPNQGLPATRNYAIERAHGEYICCLDADDKYHPEFLEKTVAVFDADPNKEYGIVTTDFRVFEKSDEHISVIDFNLAALAVQNQFHVASLFRKQCWDEVGGYATDLSGYQDWNFWLSIVGKGYKWYTIKDELFFYRNREGSMLKTSDSKRTSLVLSIIAKNDALFKANMNDIVAEFVNTQNSQLKYISDLLAAKDWLNGEIKNRDAIIDEQKKILNDIHSSYSWKLARDMSKISRMMFPAGTFRFRIMINMYSGIKYFLRKTRNLFRKIKRSSRRILSFVKRIFFHPKKIYLVNEQWDERLPFLSVVIPCFNYGKYVEEAVDSVLSQTFGNIEIIVVDGCSDDAKTKDILSKLSKPKTKIVFRETRCLVGVNRNFGISLAKGKYICCLDADDKLGDTYFEKALFYLEKYGYDVVYPGAQCFGESDLKWHAAPTTYEKMLEQNYVPTVAIFSKKAWEVSGGYKDWPIGEKHVPEDWDFWTRLAGMGFRFKAIPELLMHYRVHGSGLTAKNGNLLENQRKAIINENGIYSKSEFRKKRKPLEVIIRNPYRNLMIKKERKRILLALPFTIIGGADSVMLKIFGHLRGEYDITIITTVKAPAEFGDNSPAYRKITPELYHLPLFAGSNREAEEFVRYLSATRYFDVIFMVGCELMYRLLPEIKKNHPEVKVIDQLFNEFGHMQNNRKYSKYIDYNVVANDLISEILNTKYRETNDRIKVITHSVDTENEYNPGNIPKSDLKSVFDGITEETLIVSFFGRLSIEKAPDVFIEIAKCLRGRNIRFIMTGNGPEYEKVRDLISQYGLEKTVFLPGFVDDIKPYIRATDIVMIPSRIEGLPIILLEAMSCGVPVVASNVGGIPKVIENGINGFLCEKENVGSFVSAVEKVYENRILLDDMKVKTREYAVRVFNEKRMLDEYSSVIQSVLRG